MISALLPAFLADWFPSRMLGKASGGFNAVASAGMGIGPWFFGTVLDATHSYSVSWTTLGVVAFLSAALSISIIRMEEKINKTG